MDLNPKTVPTEELYGHISLSTREWKDGLLSTIMRDLGAIPNEAPKWIILDGDLDANWIESMNSVMDDNRVRHWVTFSFSYFTTYCKIKMLNVS